MNSLSHSQPNRHNRAFTLLEIMLVVMIIALLATAAVHFLRGNLEVSQDVRVRADLKAIATQLMVYETQNGSLPSTEQGLKALVEKPADKPVPRRWIQLFEELPQDSWHQDYVLEVPARRSKARFDLYSPGKDGQPNTADDIGNWNAQ